MPRFPEPEWFTALGQLMESRRELFQRLGFAETRFALRILRDDGSTDAVVGLTLDGYRLSGAQAIDDLEAFDADFTICGKRSVWDRMLGEIAAGGRPQLRHTLSSLALMGDELWLESSDQLREDKFYRYNQTLQEFLNLASELRE